MILKAQEAATILWTGGWDSTFRVLYVAIVEKARVEPYYIVDTLRHSSLLELRAIGEIRKALLTFDREAGLRIGPLHVTAKSDIPEYDAITALWTRLLTHMDIAPQYDWLARYAQDHNLTNLELCVEKEGHIYGLLGKHVEQVNGAYRVKPGAVDGAELFARFSFPVFGYSKVNMRSVAINHGFLEILEKSWFCHRPIFRKPCGMCAPCQAVVRHGLGYRLSTAALIHYHVGQVVKKIYRSVRKS